MIDTPRYQDSCRLSGFFLKKHIGGGKRPVVQYYSLERKAAFLKRLLPPLSLSMAEASRREEVVSDPSPTHSKPSIEA
jgi:hypothetical protein